MSSRRGEEYYYGEDWAAASVEASSSSSSSYYSEEVEEDPLWWRRVKDFLRHLTAFLFSHVGVCVLVVGYTVAGAFMFQAIEDGEAQRAAEDAAEAKERVEDCRKEVVDFLWSLIHSHKVFEWGNWTNITAEKVHSYGELVVKEAQDHAIEATTYSRTWSISAAFLYSLTVITTIGYGNVAPKTGWGKIVTILYGIAGMPLFLLYMSNVGDVLATSFKWLYARCCQCRWRRRRLPRPPPATEDEVDAKDAKEVWQVEAWEMYGYVEGGEEEGPGEEEGEEEDEDPQNVTVPISLCLGLMASYVYGGAQLFRLWGEPWDVLDGSYFCFISLSTIGFGDLVPGTDKYSEDSIELSFVFCSMYLMVGMALIAMCFNLMQEQVVSKVRACGRKCGCNKRSEEDS